MYTNDEILTFLNKLIREEHGMPVKYTDMLSDSDLDSFGFNMIIMEMDSKYGCFNESWFNENVNKDLLVKTIIDRVHDESK